MPDSDTSTRRTWFITGTSSGVGHELALTALERGDRVAATARNTGPLADLVSSFPDQVLAVELDVRDENAARLVVKRTMEAFGRIDVVVNNAACSARSRRPPTSRPGRSSTPTCSGY